MAKRGQITPCLFAGLLDNKFSMSQNGKIDVHQVSSPARDNTGLEVLSPLLANKSVQWQYYLVSLLSGGIGLEDPAQRLQIKGQANPADAAQARLLGLVARACESQMTACACHEAKTRDLRITAIDCIVHWNLI